MISPEKPIALFASGLSVLNLTPGELQSVKTGCYVLTTNYPLTLIHPWMTSDGHAFGDVRTLIYARDNMASVSLITRRCIAERVEAAGVPFAWVFDPAKEKLTNVCTFFWVLQLVLKCFKLPVYVYGLDFDVPEWSEYARWYDKWIPPDKWATTLQYERNMLQGRAPGEDWRTVFEAHYRANRKAYKRVAFHGWYRPPLD